MSKRNSSDESSAVKHGGRTLRAKPVSRSSPRESVIQAEIRLALGSDPDVVLWRNSAGTAEHFDDRTATVRKQRFGLTVGASDLIGIVMVPVLIHTPDGFVECRFGRFLALEIKRPGGKPSDEQRMFIELVRAKGGVAEVVDSAISALEVVAKAKGGEV